eukprot:4854451-Amphidinium_carterae.1
MKGNAVSSGIRRTGPARPAISSFNHFGAGEPRAAAKCLSMSSIALERAGRTGLPGPSSYGFAFMQKQQKGVCHLFGSLQKEHHHPPDLVTVPLPPP